VKKKQAKPSARALKPAAAVPFPTGPRPEPGTGGNEARGASPPPALEAQRTGLVKRPKIGDSGRSARLPFEPLRGRLAC